MRRNDVSETKRTLYERIGLSAPRLVTRAYEDAHDEGDTEVEAWLKGVVGADCDALTNALSDAVDGWANSLGRDQYGEPLPEGAVTPRPESNVKPFGWVDDCPDDALLDHVHNALLVSSDNTTADPTYALTELQNAVAALAELARRGREREEAGGQHGVEPRPEPCIINRQGCLDAAQREVDWCIENYGHDRVAGSMVLAVGWLISAVRGQEGEVTP